MPYTHDIMQNLINDIWKFFASVKLTVVVLLTLAVTSIIGTVIPQNASPEEYLRAFGGFLYRLFEVFDIFDMYHSWWFQLFIVLLTLNIIVCSIDRISATRKILFPGEPKFPIGRFEKSGIREDFSSVKTPDELREPFREQVARKFRYVRVADTEDGFDILAEKGRWTRLGVYVVHTSVVLLLVGALMGSLFGFEGYVNIPDVETADTIRLRNSNQMMKLPFAIRCDAFSVTYYPNNAPKEWRSSLSLISDGKVIHSKDIIVNDPLRYNGINIFQSGVGEMPGNRQETSETPPVSMDLRFTSGETGMAYDRTVKMGETVDLPEGLGTLVVKQYHPAGRFMGQNIGPAVTASLAPAQGDTVEVLLPLKFPNFDKMRKGRVVISILEAVMPEGASATKGKRPEIWYYTGLQVTKDPGVPVVYAGFLLMIGGCIITFFLGHRQMVLRVAAGKKGSRVWVACTTTRNKIGTQNRLKAFRQTLIDKG